MLLNLLYPRRCPLCDAVLPWGKNGLCEECKANIRYISDNYCFKCGKAMTGVEEEFCDDCKKYNHSFRKGRALFEYDVVRESIYRYKYNKRAEYAEFYAKEIVEKLGDEIRGYKAQALVPIPLYRWKEKKRGYNQANLIAVEMSKLLNIPVYSDLIVRSKNTTPLKNLNRDDRQNNLKKAFKMKVNVVKLNTIILIDDIYTTGSTIDEVAKEFLEVGVQKIYFITVAIGNDTIRRFENECKKLQKMR